LGGRAAKEIFDGKITTAKDVFSIMRELYVPDDEFRVGFESHEDNSAKKLRYLLAGLERQTIARDSSILRDELSPDAAITLEHIFPKSPNVEWSAVAARDPEWEDHFISRLGNVCLLPGINHALGNRSFDEKKLAYAKSRLKTTNSLAENSNWGRVEIVRRQQLMAKMALSAWRFQ
jgi:hypothetical protein